MNQALCSILCREEYWYFDESGRWIVFHEDGTGELQCSCNLNVWILADLEWKTVQRLDRVGPPEPVVESTSKRSPRLLGHLDLEITLINRVPNYYQNSAIAKSTALNGYSLAEDAFRPKTYTVRIEKGNFQEPNRCIDDTWRYALRLTFDKSPYPPESEWNMWIGGVEGSGFWEPKEFVGRRAPELDNKGKAMNDPTPGWIDNCVVC